MFCPPPFWALSEGFAGWPWLRPAELAEDGAAGCQVRALALGGEPVTGPPLAGAAGIRATRVELVRGASLEGVMAAAATDGSTAPDVEVTVGAS